MKKNNGRTQDSVSGIVEIANQLKQGKAPRSNKLGIALMLIFGAGQAQAANFIYNTSTDITLSDSYGIVYVGDGVSNVVVSLTNPGILTHTQDLVMGTIPGSDSNQIVVGPLAKLSNSPPNTNTIYIGRSGNYNALSIQSSGLAESYNVRIGGGSAASGTPTGNSATVDGGVWNIGGSLRVGSGATASSDTFSSIIIKDGGIATVLGDSFIGYSATSTDNSIEVSGLNSRLNVQDLVIGGSSLFVNSVRNSVTLSSGGTLNSATTIYIPSSNELNVGVAGILNANNIISAGTLSVAPYSAATVNGNYTQVGGTFRTYVNNGSAYGRLNVLGNASISGGTTIDVQLQNCSALTPGSTLTGIIDSSNPISFSPATVTSNCPTLELTASLSPDSTSVDITVGGVIPPNPKPNPNPIPTLGEWAQLTMMLMMIVTAGWFGRRSKLQ